MTNLAESLSTTVLLLFHFSSDLKKNVLFRGPVDEVGHDLQFLFMRGCCFDSQRWYKEPHMKNVSASSAKLLSKTL